MITFKQFIEESWGRDTAKAVGIHYRIERKRGNALMHPASIIGSTAVIGGAMALQAATGNYPTLAAQTAFLGPMLAPHIKDIKNIRRKIKEKRAREAV